MTAFLSHSGVFYMPEDRPLYMAPRLKVSCDRPGGRRVGPGPGPGWIGLFDRMSSAHTPICLADSAQLSFSSRKLVSRLDGDILGNCTV
jgi:hypothetical protein